MVTGHLFCFGLGYVGAALARALRADGWSVGGTARDPDGAADLRAAGIAVRPFALPAALDGVTHLLSTVPPEGENDPVLAAHGRAIRAWRGAWAGYLSSTAVYGDHGGGWVDEDTPPHPSGERGRRRLEAEAAWRDAVPPVHVFRLAGIYGPGRSALDQVRAGRARRIVKPGQFFSRIHVDDIVATLRASMHRPSPEAIYNLADDLPAPPDAVVAHAADLLGVPSPAAEPFETARATLSPMALSFYADNRRIANGRIKRDLGVALRYPTYREGLAAIAATT